MAEVVPFKGVLFNVLKVSKGSGEELLAPPYDIISPEKRHQLYEKSPYNIVRVDFGIKTSGDDEQDNRYSRAKALLDTWLKEQALVTNRTPGYFAYEITYAVDGKALTLRGFLGLVRLEPFGKGNIHPHEYTHSKPKKDRLELMRACEANISPIFSIYNSPEKKASSLLADVAGTKPYIEAAEDNGSIHRLWPIEDRVSVDTITLELADKAVFIADGHHRYETALEYQKEMRKKEGISDKPKPYDYVLMFFANMADEGLTILPTHRLAKDLPGDALDLLSTDFDIEKMDLKTDITGTIAGKRDVYGFYTGGETWYCLSYKGEGIHGVPPVLKDLDVTVLHDLIFKQLLDIENVSYEMDVQKCLQAVQSGEFRAAFFLNPTGVYDVERVALASLRMPPKSTYFYPKLMTGMVLNIFKNSL
jgi:uncharacterized protein (DUF1015 family)